MIGVINYEKQKQAAYSYDSKNAVCYYAYNGFKYPSGGHEGTGLKVGETVEVHVDRKNNIIKWFVDDVLRASYTL